MRPNGTERARTGRKMPAMVPPDWVIITFYAPGVCIALSEPERAEKCQKYACGSCRRPVGHVGCRHVRLLVSDFWHQLLQQISVRSIARLSHQSHDHHINHTAIVSIARSSYQSHDLQINHTIIISTTRSSY